MKKILFLLLITLSPQVYSQKEAYHWYFGFNTGLDFSVTQTVTSVNLGPVLGVPKMVEGPISTNEGCFSISDGEGNFLFASDGITVYDKTLGIMQNGTGLLGNPSATNSGIVIPIPGSKILFYLITAPATGTDGLRYSIVNLSLNGGLGAITTKNTAMPLGSSGYTAADAYENLTVVGHANTVDFWLVSRMRGKFLVWKVTASGISTPLVYNIGLDYGVHTSNQGIGAIKFSPDGSKLIHCNFSEGYITSANFNTTTGAISSIQNILTGLPRCYGVEFSPSGNYVYITAAQASPASYNGLYVKPITNLNPPYTQRVSLPSNVQMGSDSRIYAISQYSPSLWIILNPDAGGTQIAEFPDYFKTTKIPYLGLPPFITSFFNIKPITGKSLVCVGNGAEYSVEIPSIGAGSQQINYLEWNFGDGTPVVKDYSMSVLVTLYKKAHTYNTQGIYTIKVTPYLVNGLPDNAKVTTITSTVVECKIVTNKMIRTDLLPN